MTLERALEKLIDASDRERELRAALKSVLDYIDGPNNLSAQPSHPAHAARKLLNKPY